MSTKTITVCDGCGRELPKTCDRYHMDLKTDRFWNGVEKDDITYSREFCERCALDIKATLERIAQQNGEG